VAIRGTFAAMPRGRAWPRPGRYPVSVRFGPPLGPQDGETTRAFLDRLTEALARLWEEDRGTWWRSLTGASGGRSAASGPHGPRWLRLWESSRPLPETRGPRVWP
jgi:1-acyl-sn-glycerol-3-phosphate acyltransferase